jgi:hypothetical protein
MTGAIRHIAINADDVGRAKAFYEAVFGWTFQAWGPPDYYQVRNAGEGLIGALQRRRELRPGAQMLGFEVTLAVDDVDATLAAAAERGGKVIRPAFYLEGVGRLAYIEDTEGNLVGVMQYDAGVFD